MGVYPGKFKEPCPRCGEGVVTDVFVSVTPQSYSIGCSGCGANDFSDEEKEALGEHISTDMMGNELSWGKPPKAVPDWQSSDPAND